MCIDGELCLPMEIPIPHQFMLKGIEVNATDSPLSHLCSIKVHFGKEVVYNGPIGHHGFDMKITELEPRGSFALQFTADCSALHSLVSEPLESVKVFITGYIDMEESTVNTEDFNLKWS
jgi:hypothetical protein